MKPTNKENEKFDINKVKVYRTLEGTIFEIVSILVLAVTWTIALVQHQFDGDIQDEWKIALIIITVAIIAILGVVYYPRLFNNKRQLRNIEQVAITIRMNRVIALELALMVLCNAVMSCKLFQQTSWALCIVGIILITVLVFSFLIYKAK